MADRNETHAWYDGVSWHVYSERHYDIARFTKWFGPPSRLGQGRVCAHWDNLPPDAAAFRRRTKRKVSDKARAAAQNGRTPT